MRNSIEQVSHKERFSDSNVRIVRKRPSRAKSDDQPKPGSKADSRVKVLRHSRSLAKVGVVEETAKNTPPSYLPDNQYPTTARVSSVFPTTHSRSNLLSGSGSTAASKKQHRGSINTRNKKKKGKLGGYWPCSAFCTVLSLLGAILLLAGIAAILVATLGSYQSKTTSTAAVSTSSVANTVSNSITNNTPPVASTITTESTTTATIIGTTATTSTTTETTATPSNTTETTATTSTTTGTTATTTTTTVTTTSLPACATSCLNQTWLSTSSLISYWRFENDYTDETGAYNGTATGSPTFVAGYAGQAVSFAANTNQMVSTSHIPLNNRSFSISVWIYPTGLTNVLHSSICGLCPSASNDFCLHMTLRLTSGTFPLYFGLYADDVNSNAPPVLVNNWVHAAFTFDVTTRKISIYRNGILLNTGTTTSALKATNGSFQIGNIPLLVPSINTFQGYIDELSLSSRLWSACEILEQATLAARFSFDGGSPLDDLGPGSLPSLAQNYSITSGRTLQAIAFAGISSSYFQASGFLALGTANQPFSLSLWVQPQTLAGTLVQISTSGSGTGSCRPFMGFSSNGSLVAQVPISASYAAVLYSSLQLMSFSHVVQTWSPTNGLRLYVNTALVGSIAAATYTGTSTWINYLTVGDCLSGCVSCYTGAGNRIAPGPFAGAVDDFRVFSRELNVTDVCNLFVHS